MNSYNNPTISIYLHLENDQEFIERLRKQVAYLSNEVLLFSGESLDQFVWRNFRLQRRLVWVTP